MLLIESVYCPLCQKPDDPTHYLVLDEEFCILDSLKENKENLPDNSDLSIQIFKELEKHEFEDDLFLKSKTQLESKIMKRPENYFNSLDSILNHLKHKHQWILYKPQEMVYSFQEYINFLVSQLANSINEPISLTKKPVDDEKPLLPEQCPVTVNMQNAGSECFLEVKEEFLEIRNYFHYQKLLLQKQRQEKEKSIISKPYPCLFCKSVSTSARDLLSHMYQTHSFSLGQMENILYYDLLWLRLSRYLMDNRCLYCLNLFTNAAILRKHMRKKKHFKMHPQNLDFDGFYISNYQDPTTPYFLKKETSEWKDKEDDFSEWEEDIDQPTKCLHCLFIAPTPEFLITKHFPEIHDVFDFFGGLKQRFKTIDHYQTIQCIHYMRKCLSESKCCFCEEVVDLDHHLKTNHSHIYPKTLQQFTSHSQYLMPFYEGDPLLQSIDYDSDK